MNVTIVPVTWANIDQVLPLIADYQRFYQATPNDARNRAHFGKLIDHAALGAQWVAMTDEGLAVGFVTAYRVLSSVSAVEKCLLNDLYVVPALRGKGLGKQLILHCHAWAKSEGYNGVHWQTAPDNHTAQRLYDSLPTTRSEWYTYTLNDLK
ncbi:MAG: GNAT family N-acetyltransferase [Roseiflexaceae bacterium]